ncbi:type I-E CRISPR-associated protein Cse2/CasB [uncultured Parvimonas sp.]|uniref:type I-E CRISPR-associated protein Cse2/CasB n=1 Tax=uncultured Parvimonas sp. TaxID=747372 RepID=UPI0028D788B5|nr:type I-E CRISPR-associated protein Cse2/CasB [uncultured Parvimonas sp.]
MQKKSDVYLVAGEIISRIEHMGNESSRKAILANIRKSIGKELTDMTDIWKILFENLPEDFLGTTGKATFEENAIISTLQIYAISMQGSKSSYDTEEKLGNMGQSLSILRIIGDCEPIDQRFNTMVTSSNYEEFTYHLRSLIKILKSKSIVKIDYSKLAKDLFLYQSGFEKEIKLQWARSFYKKINVKKQEEE